MSYVPFTSKWITKKIEYFINNILVIKGNKYHTIKKNIRNRLKFLCFKFPDSRILVLKNYYRKNHLIICIRPILSQNQIVISKNNKCRPIWSLLNKKINVFDYYKPER